MTDSRTEFYGRVSNKQGRALYKSNTYRTRAEAIADCFAARPRARDCSTSRVDIRVLGGIEYVLDGHMDIQYHNRREFDRLMAATSMPETVSAARGLDE